MRQNPERTAWFILILAFLSFCVLVVGLPLGIRWYVENAEIDQKASIECLAGTIIIDSQTGSGPSPLSKGSEAQVSQGTSLYADETSEAVVTFADQSFMRIYPGTTVRLDTLRAPRYESGIRPVAIYLALLGGRVRLGTAVIPGKELDMVVTSSNARITLFEEGSYLIDVDESDTEVAVYRGQAVVSARGASVEVPERQRTTVRVGEAPSEPVGVARNLVQNSNLRPPLDEWLVYNEQGTDGGNIDGQVEAVVDSGVAAVRLWRVGGQGNHCETVLEQPIDAVLPEPVSSLIVRVTLKVRYQQLSGGGYLSSEYPLMIRLTYRDKYDSEGEWIQGFYYQNVDRNPIAYGIEIPQDRWYVYESENLMASLPVTPTRIMSIRVYASGWDYDSLISDINLIIE